MSEKFLNKIYVEEYLHRKIHYSLRDFAGKVLDQATSYNRRQTGDVRILFSHFSSHSGTFKTWNHFPDACDGGQLFCLIKNISYFPHESDVPQRTTTIVFVNLNPKTRIKS